jgi:DNA replication and repair protein RecF
VLRIAMPEALRIAKLWARRFRNLAELEVVPGPRFNVFFGDNGQGKSNLLEAIDYLGSLRSFRGAASADMVQRGASDAELAADVHGENVPRHVRVRVPRGGAREVQLDGKRPRSRASYLGAVQTVLFHPGDLQLASGPPELRRAFVDRILEHFDPTFASTLAAYVRALKSRNHLLRSERPDRRAIAAYHEVLAAAGAVVGQARARLISEVAPLASDAYAKIGGEAQALGLRYEPRVEPKLEAIRAALEQSVDKDLARGFTAEGPHGDELALTLDGIAAKRYGSQGQHRSIVLALKVAELHELTRRVGRVPVLLLDDVSSELDRGRRRRLFALLSDLGGQVFLTTTQPELIEIDHHRADWRIESGHLTPN